jgi:putative endonuclease
VNSWYVYILSNDSHTLYVGYTNDVLRRFAEHKLHADPRGFTSRYTFDRLVYIEVVNSEEEAEHREKQIKGWVRKKKIALIERENPRWHDLSPRLRDLSWLK